MTTQQPRNGSIPHSKGVSLKATVWRLQRRLEFELSALTRRVNPESVHEARTTARRLRALLHEFRAQLSPSAARQYHYRLKHVTRDLGGLRDADVAQQSVAVLTRDAHAKRHKALDALNAALDHRRHRLAGRLQARMAKSVWSRDLRKLRTAAADVALILPNGRPVADLARPLLARRRRRLRARLRKATRSEHALHRLRLNVKRLRYFLEESASIDTSPGSARELRLLKGLQDCLGQLHDLALLKDLLEGGAPCRIARKELRKKCHVRRKRLLSDYDELRVGLLHWWDTTNRAGH